MAQWLANPTGSYGVAGSVPGPRSVGWGSGVAWAVVWVADTAWILRCCGSGIGWQLWLRLDPWCGNLHVLLELEKTKQKKKKKKKEDMQQWLSYYLEHLLHIKHYAIHCE